jgi:hypothetical protein
VNYYIIKRKVGRNAHLPGAGFRLCFPDEDFFLKSMGRSFIDGLLAYCKPPWS